ncbi:Germin protein [Dioscorea alata]|uniref:Germin protein n=1 Tax=Dioscorea alata TaxID=55571 RepID=A0ACB7WEF0_DIOAL|nr:Germin protein [Dioscorea alata]
MDPDPIEDFCIADLTRNGGTLSCNYGFPCKPLSQVTSEDFVFSGLTKPGNTTNLFGSAVTPGSVDFFPAVNTLGLSANRVDFAPGGILPPHSHPRATELITIIHGKVLIGIITSNNQVFSRVVEKGEVFIVPRGLLHFQYNVGKNKARTYTVFNSQKPGIINTPISLFASLPLIPDEVLVKSYMLDTNLVQVIRDKFAPAKQPLK